MLHVWELSVTVAWKRDVLYKCTDSLELNIRMMVSFMSLDLKPGIVRRKPNRLIWETDKSSETFDFYCRLLIGDTLVEYSRRNLPRSYHFYVTKSVARRLAQDVDEEGAEIQTAGEGEQFECDGQQVVA